MLQKYDIIIVNYPPATISTFRMLSFSLGALFGRFLKQFASLPIREDFYKTVFEKQDPKSSTYKFSCIMVTKSSSLSLSSSEKSFRFV